MASVAVKKALADIQDRAEEILKEGKMPVASGGRASGDTGCCESCRREISWDFILFILMRTQI